MSDNPTHIKPSRPLRIVNPSANGSHHFFRGGRPIKLVIVGAISVIAILAFIASSIQKWLWMRQLGYTGVFWTLLSVRWELFCAAFVVALLYLWINLRLAARNGAISGGIRRSQGASFGRAHWRGSVRTLHKLLYCCCRSRRSWVMIADTAPTDDAPADGLHCKGCMDARCPHCRHEHTQPRQRPGVRCDRNPCQTLSVIHSSLSC